MRNKTLWIIVMFLVALVLAPTAAAQSSVEETLDAYYEALTESLDTGDPAAWLEFFAEDAVMEVPALAPQPVTGKDLIEAAMWPGVFSQVGGSVIEETLREVDGNTASVYAMWLGGTGGDFPIQEIFEFNDDGLITSYTVNVGATPEGAEEEAAPAASVDETLDAYYVALTEALDTGDPAAWLEFFAEDAEMSVPALAPQPVTGKDLIEAAMWPGVFANVGGSVVEETLREVDGNTASVYAMWLGGTGGDMPIQEIFEFNDDGLIQSYTVNVGATPEGEAEAPAEEETATEEEPATLPESGGVLVNLLPGLLILGGAAMVGLGKRFSR